MLSQTVATNTTINYPGIADIMCHSATLFWLYTDEFRSSPSLDVFTSRALMPPAPLIRSMLRLGSQVKNASSLSRLAAGTVIVFVSNGEPMHSCVALPGNRIGGFNQTGWYTTNGIGGRYSAHNMTEVQWFTEFMNKNEVRGSNDQMRCKLIAIPENSAKAIVRQAIQK